MRLYGKRPVLERLTAAPKSIRALYIEQGVDAADVVNAAKSAGISFDSLGKRDFAHKAGDLHAQGVLAEIDEFQYVDLDRMMNGRGEKPTLVLLDRVTDPQNLGAILRTLACLGSFGLVLPKHDSVEVTETVLRVACGGENYVPVARVTNLTRGCENAKEAGYWIAGAAASGGTPLPEAKLPVPLAVILGSEGSGIRPGLTKHLDLTVTLPMAGAALSFNVAAAAALIGYEITRRRKENL